MLRVKKENLGSIPPYNLLIFSLYIKLRTCGFVCSYVVNTNPQFCCDFDENLHS